MTATKLPRALEPKEKDVQRAVRSLLEMFGIDFYDTSQFFRAAITPGVPDLICFCPKRGQFYVECKRAKRGRWSEAQQRFAGLCRRAAVPYILATSVADVGDFLRGGPAA